MLESRLLIEGEKDTGMLVKADVPRIDLSEANSSCYAILSRTMLGRAVAEAFAFLESRPCESAADDETVRLLLRELDNKDVSICVGT